MSGQRINEEKMVREYYVKSRSADDYKQMVANSLYHPPKISFYTNDDQLNLIHKFEEKPLVREFIDNTLLGVEWLWGGPVKLETSEVKSIDDEEKVVWEKVKYSMTRGKLKRGVS